VREKKMLEYASQRVDFPQGQFSRVPVVRVRSDDEVGLVFARNVSATGFDLVVVEADGTAPKNGHQVRWDAYDYAEGVVVSR
jgi:hypothetical protein